MKGHEYGRYTCKVCKIRKRAWVESDCYKEKLCPRHLDHQTRPAHQADEFEPVAGPKTYDIHFFGWSDSDDDVLEEWLDRTEDYDVIRVATEKLLYERTDMERAEIIDKVGEEIIILEKTVNVIERARVPYTPLDKD